MNITELVVADGEAAFCLSIARVGLDQRLAQLPAFLVLLERLAGYAQLQLNITDPCGMIPGRRWWRSRRCAERWT
jgi:hypothetical protein